MSDNIPNAPETADVRMNEFFTWLWRRLKGNYSVGGVVFGGANGVFTQDATNFVFDDTNNFLGIGTATPGYDLDIRKGANTTAIHISGNNADDGLYLNSFSSSISHISSGAAWNGTNWIAKTSTAVINAINNSGNLYWYLGSSLTPGNSWSPVLTASLTPSGWGWGPVVPGSTRSDVGFSAYSNLPAKAAGNPWHIKASNLADTKAAVFGLDDAAGVGVIGALQHGVAWLPLLICPNGGGVSIGHGNAPGYTLDLNAAIDGIRLCNGTTAQRPGGASGVIRHNTDINSPEFYAGAWTQFVGVLDRQVTQNDVNTTAAETSFYSFSVPANILDTQKMLRLRIYGDFLCNNGAGQTLRVKLKFGGTIWWDETSTALTAAAGRHPFDWEFLIGNQNATNVQAIGGTVGLGNATAATVGLGDVNAVITNATGFLTQPYATGNIDTTAARTLEVTVQHSASSANQSIRRQFAILEIL